MNKENRYFECILIDDSKLEFDKLCTVIEEFGANKDMIAFKSKHLDNKIILGIIPKNQIKHIINHYSKEDMNKIWQN